MEARQGGRGEAAVTLLHAQVGCAVDLATYYLLLTTHYSLPTTHYPLLTTHYPLLTTHY